MAGHQGIPYQNVLGDFALAHGFTHARELTWIEAVGLVEKLDLIRHIDMSDRESYLGRHPQLDLIAVLVSTVSTCFVFANQDPSPALRSHISLA
ncbi:MAG TPA: hypothetical protein VGC74_02335 [Stenotrophomonas sp.]|jgi:hypothetical protein